MLLPPTSILILIAMAIALWHCMTIQRPRPLLFNLLAVLIVLAIGVELYGGFVNAQGLNNTIGYNVFNLLEAYLVLLIAHSIKPAWKGLLAILAMVITAAFITNLRINDPGTLLHDAIIFSAMIQAAVCMALLWHLAQTSELPLVRVPEFWLLLGFLIYFAGLVPVIGLQRFVYAQDWPTASKLYKIVPGLCVIRYLLAAYSCRLATKASRNGPAWRSASAP